MKDSILREYQRLQAEVRNAFRTLEIRQNEQNYVRLHQAQNKLHQFLNALDDMDVITLVNFH